MPWEIRQGTSQCSGYGVFKEGTNELEGCHETREKAQAQMAALYSTEEMDKNMSKAMVSEGDFVTFMCDDERMVGRVEYVMTNPGTLGIDGSEYSLEYMENDKPIIIRIYEEEDGAWEEDKYLVYKRMYDTIKIESLTVIQDVEMEMVSKADSVRVGQMVSWGSSGGNAKGKVKRIIRDGSYNVPDSDFTITGTPDNPAVVIEVYRDGKPTGRMVGHKMETLRATKSIWNYFDPRQAVSNRPTVDLFKRDYSRESRERMASSGQAMDDGSFPIANRTDLRNAIQSVGRAKNYEAAKRHIIRRARALGATEMLPEDWK